MNAAARIVETTRILIAQGEPALVAFERACSEVSGPRSARRLAAQLLTALDRRDPHWTNHPR